MLSQDEQRQLLGIARSALEAALARHRERWSNACRSLGARFVTVTAERLVESGRLKALEQCGLLEGA